MLEREPDLLPEEYKTINTPLILNNNLGYTNITTVISIPHKLEIKNNKIYITLMEKTKTMISISVFSNNKLVYETELRIISKHMAVQIMRKYN